jgi:hypothetical protein
MLRARAGRISNDAGGKFEAEGNCLGGEYEASTPGGHREWRGLHSGQYPTAHPSWISCLITASFRAMPALRPTGAIACGCAVFTHEQLTQATPRGLCHSSRSRPAGQIGDRFSHRYLVVLTWEPSRTLKVALRTMLSAIPVAVDPEPRRRVLAPRWHPESRFAAADAEHSRAKAPHARACARRPQTLAQPPPAAR